MLEKKLNDSDVVRNPLGIVKIAASNAQEPNGTLQPSEMESVKKTLQYTLYRLLVLVGVSIISASGLFLLILSIFSIFGGASSGHIWAAAFGVVVVLP